MSLSNRMKNIRMISPECCPKHGSPFEISQELNEQMKEFVDKAVLYMNTGDMMLFGGMISLAMIISDHPEYSYACREYNKRGYGDQLTILNFFAIGGKAFRKSIITGVNHVSNEL